MALYSLQKNSDVYSLNWNVLSGCLFYNDFYFFNWRGNKTNQ